MTQKKKQKKPTQVSDIDYFLKPKHSWESIENLTASKLERMLSNPEYKVRGYWDKSALNEKELKQHKKAEGVVSFGKDVANLFEDMVEQLGHIPTQEEYIEKGTAIISDWWIDGQKTNPKIKGVPFTWVVQRSVEERLARTWTSNIVEIHTVLLVKELFPQARVVQHDLLDLVAGVDFVMELDNKRYYFHVFKNTEWGMKSFKQKESRGGLFKGKEFIKFKRDFTGDVILAYEWDTRTDHTSTKFINNIPMFKSDFMEWKVNMTHRTSLGETVGDGQSKLNQLESWVKEKFNKVIKF